LRALRDIQRFTINGHIFYEVAMVQVRGWGHVVLKVSDLARAERFYTERLGFRRVGWRRGMVFLRCGDQHHDLALLEIGPDGVKCEDPHLGLFHIALAVSSLDDLVRAYHDLKTAGVEIFGSVDHVVSKSFYLEDPDGNEIELYADEPRERWEGLKNPFATDLPFEIRKT
jgi:catechol 2,3-dioxygenase